MVTGYVPVGNGIGAAVLANGQLNVVAGPLFAQIIRERLDGPRWAEALRGTQQYRNAWWRHPSEKKAPDTRAATLRARYVDGKPRLATPEELRRGVPVEWADR